MIDRVLLRRAATYLLTGLVVFILAGIFHAEGGDPNVHVPTFTAYANSSSWTLVHLGQFVGIFATVMGLLVLYYAVRPTLSAQTMLGRFATTSAVIALTLYGALQAVDGVALKQAANAWAGAAEADKAMRFAVAEGVRWTEWGLRSYHSFMFGLSLILFALLVARIGRKFAVVGYLMGVTGLAYLVQGWVLGTEGFSANNSIPTLVGYASWIIWSIWLLAASWNVKEAGAGARV